MIASFTIDVQLRHFLFLHAISYIIIATAVTQLARDVRRPLPRSAYGVVGGLVLIAVAAPAVGLWHRFDNPVVGPDYPAAMRYIADHHESGQPVVTAFPPAAYLGLGGRTDLLYLVRFEGHRYTVQTAAGSEVDRWVGSPIISSVADL